MPPLLIDRRQVAVGLALAALASPVLAKTTRKRTASHARPHVAALPGDMALGSARAPVTIVEYASVGCPVCGRWHKEVYPALKAKWIDTGRARFVFREMLVGGQDEVTVAAAGFTLARAAGPSRYFQVVDAIFDSQPALFNDPDGVLSKVAAGVGIPHDRFEALIRDEPALKALQDRVQANIKQDAVDSTPTFVVNGTKLTAGYQTLTALEAAMTKAAA